MTKTDCLEIEYDGPRNECFAFPPLQGKRIRGRFDLRRVAEPNAMRLVNQFPNGIPGQRLGINLETGEGYIADPLHDPEHAATRERIEAKGQRLPPARETFPAQHVPTWLHWLASVVKAGKARIIKGTLPSKIDGAQTAGFITHRTKPAELQLAEAIQANTAVLAEVLRQLKKGG